MTVSMQVTGGSLYLSSAVFNKLTFGRAAEAVLAGLDSEQDE